jgi:CRISPR type III-B/RAMP module-associated protein Cmr5
MPVKNIAHDNARKAFDAITDVKENHSGAKKEYLSLVRGADAFIHQCGLLQTLAFYLAKDKDGKEHHRLLLEHLLKHLIDNLPKSGSSRLLDGYNTLLNKKDDTLMLDTAKIRSYLLWLKRYAEAMLDEKKQNNGGGTDGDSNQPETSRSESERE